MTPTSRLIHVEVDVFPNANNVAIVYQDLVHHCTAIVLEEVRSLYTDAGRNPRQLKYLHIWSDNCASQFKCANTFGWASRFMEIGKLIAIVSCKFHFTFFACWQLLKPDGSHMNTHVVIFVRCSFLIFLLLSMGKDSAMGSPACPRIGLPRNSNLGLPPWLAWQTWLTFSIAICQLPKVLEIDCIQSLKGSTLEFQVSSACVFPITQVSILIHIFVHIFVNISQSL